MISAVRSEVRSVQRTKSVLVVEDEADLADLICFNLEREGYAHRRAAFGDQAIDEIRKRPPDLILLDRMLPGTSGDEVCAQVRRDPSTAGIPIIMITAKSDEAEQLVGFALGADDYIAKPFSVRVLMARVAAMLRRGESTSTDPGTLVVGPFVLNVARHEVTVAGQVLPLTATEFRLLRVLMAARGRVLDRSQLIEKVLGSGVVVTDRTIDVHITALRKKVGQVAADPRVSLWIQTIRGAGYAFREPVAN